jgi:predicted peroxiredoxin
MLQALKPFPGRQTAFLAAQQIDEVAYLGEKGPGKSHSFLIDALTYIQESDYRALILRRTYTDLTDIIDKSHAIYPSLGGVYNSQSHTWTFPKGAKIRFGYIDHHNDLGTYIGNEFQALYFDECGQIPLEWYKEMRSCLRTKNPRIKCKTRCASNPVGQYVLDYWTRFIDTLPEGVVGYFTYDENGNDVQVDKDNPEAESRCWFRCLRTENPLINNKEYEKTLRGLSKGQREAYLRGELILESKPDQLIPFEDIERALNRKKDIEQGAFILSIDVASMGNDSCVFVFGRNHQILDIKQYKKMTIPELERLVDPYIDKYKHQILIMIDAGGMGVGLFQNLQDHRKEYANNIVGVNSKSAALNQKHKDQQFSTVLKFYDDRSWMWWLTKVAFEENRINLSAIKTSPLLNMFMKEIGFITFTDDTGEIKVVTKKELRKTQKLGGSPDFADAICYYILGYLQYLYLLKTHSTHEDSMASWQDPIPKLPNTFNTELL